MQDDQAHCVHKWQKKTRWRGIDSDTSAVRFKKEEELMLQRSTRSSDHFPGLQMDSDSDES